MSENGLGRHDGIIFPCPVMQQKLTEHLHQGSFVGKLLGPSTAIVPCENYKDNQTPRADFWLRLMGSNSQKHTELSH